MSEIGEEVKQLNFDRISSEFQSPSLIVFYSTITISYLLAVSAELKKQTTKNCNSDCLAKSLQSKGNFFAGSKQSDNIGNVG